MTTPTVVLLMSVPEGEQPLDLEGERAAIEQELGEAGLAGRLRVIPQPSTTPRSLQRCLLTETPEVVQFSGHGRGGAASGRKRGLTEPFASRPSGIVMQGDRGGAERVVSGRALANLFELAGKSVRLVVLNACHSAEQADAIATQVDAVIGIDGAIRDDAASVFAVALYRALAFGRSIGESFRLAVNALMLEGFDDERLPVLQAKAGVDLDAVTLVEAPAPDTGTQWDVFVSYGSPDQPAAEALAQELRHRHLRVFLDAWEIGPGQAPVSRLDQGLANSEHGVIVASVGTLSRKWVQAEYAALLDRALSEDRRLIPVLVGADPGDLPPLLRTRQWVDLRGAEGPERQWKIESIARAVRGLPPGPPPRVR